MLSGEVFYVLRHARQGKAASRYTAPPGAAAFHFTFTLACGNPAVRTPCLRARGRGAFGTCARRGLPSCRRDVRKLHEGKRRLRGYLICSRSRRRAHYRLLALVGGARRGGARRCGGAVGATEGMLARQGRHTLRIAVGNRRLLGTRNSRLFLGKHDIGGKDCSRKLN